MKKRQDATTTAALEIVAMEQQQNQLEKLQLKKREAAVAQVMRVAGRIEAMNFSEAQSRFFKLIMLKQVKEAKEYRDEFGMTWQQFCDMVGVDRRWVDEQLSDLKPLKAQFLEAFLQFSGFDFHKIKYLAEAKLEGIAKIEGSTILYDGREISITPENKDEIQAVLDQIETKYKSDLENAQGDARASKRVLKDKESLINKQAKRLDQLEGKARNKDLLPEEDGFLQQMENAKIGFDGYMLGVDPGRIEELKAGDEKIITPRMRAAYLETLGYMRRQITAAHDTAVEMFGADMALEGEAWKPGK